MKKYKNRIIGTVSMCCIALLMAGCSNQSSIVKSTPENSIETPIIKKVSKELLSYMPSKLSNSYFYQGTYEYGHELRVNIEEKSENKVIYNFSGTIDTNSTTINPDDKFYIKMTIDNDKITYESDYAWNPVSKFTALKLPLALNNEWCESVLINNTEYNATSKIILIKDTESGRVITVETIANGVEGYKDGVYKQIISYKEDLGISEVENEFLYKDYTDTLIQKNYKYEFSGVANR